MAIKVLHDKYGRDEHYQARFRREARSLASLSHPSIAQIFSIDSAEDDSLYIVMEYVEGHSVQERLAEEGSFSAAEAVRSILQVARGLQAALEGGLVHRDIKPSNLLLRPDGVVKIVDFGLSKEVSKDNTLTEEGIVLGTPHYLSPEQGRGKPVDHRSDIYALGATFYHMVTGKPPFEGRSQVSIIVAHVEEDPPSPRTLCSNVPDALSEVIGKMMARKVTDRYETYDQLVEDLELLENGKNPVHTGGGTGRFSSKGPPAIVRTLSYGMAVLVLIILFLGHHLFGIWGVLLGVPVTHYFIQDVFGVPVWSEKRMAPNPGVNPVPNNKDQISTKQQNPNIPRHDESGPSTTDEDNSRNDA